MADDEMTRKGSLLASNLAMLTKWWWRFKSENNSLWHQVITSIFGTHGRLETNIFIPIRHSHVSPWKEIYGLNKDLLKVNINLDSIFLMKIGDGSVFKFWHDCWFGTSNFMSLFPRMYALETHKDCLISERCFSGGLMDLPSHVWAWRRSPRDGIEKAQFDDLVNLLVGFKPTDVRDSWTCSLSSLNTYTVSSMRCAIDSSTLVSTIDKVKWNKTLPIKINIHSWRLRKDRLPTRSNLDARGIDIDSLRCPVCNDAIESTTHLFVECTVAADIWSRIKDWWGLGVGQGDGPNMGTGSSRHISESGYFSGGVKSGKCVELRANRKQNSEKVSVENKKSTETHEQEWWTPRRDKREVSPSSSVGSEGGKSNGSNLDNNNNKKKVGRRSVTKAFTVARETGVKRLGENKKGVSDAYKEYYEVSSESNGIFHFGNNSVGESDCGKCNISIEQVKEVGELIGVSWVRAEEESKMEKHIVSLNVRGTGESEKRRWIRNIIRNEQPDVIGLQETKSGVVDDFWIEELWGCNISMEQVKEVGELIGVSWMQAEGESKKEGNLRVENIDEGAAIMKIQ
ncbi:reverse transcriptase domain, Reverse transcriptase zinc-binding domain protein [Artemisia annua]|uniref:Reverse transcriptase domain, Reverse transcriptase zinc-binding domain protein n=1 Tax=Artemisia annua TaxID=35608 RepID=A0A2U1MR10_ARTAN|nr:reverse transcriptase domain, Reverse transcriptase zinc-binding domain protein [Artemisia annua]